MPTKKEVSQGTTQLVCMLVPVTTTFESLCHPNGEQESLGLLYGTSERPVNMVGFLKVSHEAFFMENMQRQIRADKIVTFHKFLNMHSSILLVHTVYTGKSF